MEVGAWVEASGVDAVAHHHQAVAHTETTLGVVVGEGVLTAWPVQTGGPVVGQVDL